MKVTLINHSDSLGGASTVTFNLMEALRARDIDARMLVVHKASSSPYVERGADEFSWRRAFLAEHLRIFGRNGFSRRTLFKISTATDGVSLHRHPWVREADVVILNWINQGMLSLDEIGRIAASRPVIWTMHDMWNLTGVCHHAGDCDRFTRRCSDCPLLGKGAGDHDLAARVFDNKRKLYDSVPISFVAVSDWLARRAADSALTTGRDVSVIRNAFDIEAFAHPVPRNRSELGLPWKGRIILMCAARLDDPFKNLPGAVEALNTLTDTDAVAVFTGEVRHPEALDSLRLPHTLTGPVGDPARLRSMYSHASVVMSSSTYESFGATLLEGQAAGATPVGYVHDGRADIITDGVSGYSAGAHRSLGEALRLALDRPIPRKKLYEAACRYSFQTISDQYIELIESTIQKHKLWTKTKSSSEPS